MQVDKSYESNPKKSINRYVMYKQLPDWAPSSTTCNLDVICPALVTFVVAKDIRVDGFSLPET